MPHQELGFLKIGAAHFSLSETKSAPPLQGREPCEPGAWAALSQGDLGRSSTCLVLRQPSRDSLEQQGALSPHGPAARDTASIPSRAHRIFQPAEQTLTELGCRSSHSQQPGKGNTCSRAQQCPPGTQHPECWGSAGTAPLDTTSFNTLQCQAALLGKETSHIGEIK